MTASSNFFHRGDQFLIHLNALLLAHFLQGFRVPIAFPRLLATRPSCRHIAASEPASRHFLRKWPRHRAWLQAPKTLRGARPIQMIVPEARVPLEFCDLGRAVPAAQGWLTKPPAQSKVCPRENSQGWPQVRPDDPGAHASAPPRPVSGSP